MMSKSIIDRPIYIMIKYFYYFFLTNFYFIVCNILFFIVFYLADIVFENILLFYITLIPMGPSITAVLSSMAKLVREKDIEPTKDFFKAYHLNFITTMKYWLIQLTIIFILLIDILQSASNTSLFSPIYLILLIACIFIMIYAFPIISRFEVKIKNLFIISIYANFKYAKSTLLNVSTIIAFGFIYYNFPSLSTLFTVSLIGYFIMLNIQGPFVHMEEEMSNQK
jgi:uncharacterized membrane protein YesL